MLQTPLRRPLLAKLAQRACGQGQVHTAPNPKTSLSSTSCSRRHYEQPPPRHQRRGYSDYPGAQAPGRSRPFNALALLGLGALMASPFYLLLTPTTVKPPPAKDSPKDLDMRAKIQARAAALPLVQSLLASPEWSAHHHDAYAAFEPASRPKRLTTGPLGSSAGLGGYQHVFHNSATGEVLTVVYLGHNLMGFPLVAHGGVLATLLDEQCARAAMQDATFAGAGANKKGIVTARLEIDYRSLTPSDSFCVVRARAVPEAELQDKDKGKRGRKVWVRTNLETVDGRVCVEGRALHVKPAGVDLKAVGENF